MEPRLAPPLSLSLPNTTDLSPQHLGFLDQHLSTHQDLLLNASNLSSSLSQQCSELDTNLQNLQNDLTKRAVSWISRSFSAKLALDNLNNNLQNLSLRTSRRQYIKFFFPFVIFLFGKLLMILTFFLEFLDGIGSKKFLRVLSEELPRLAKEVKRIEAIRSYVGELEDSVYLFSFGFSY